MNTWTTMAVAATLALAQVATVRAAASDGGSEVAANSATSIDIPPGPLAEALDMLARQTGSDLVYRPEQVAELKTPGIKGNLTTEEAIVKLIRGTHLRLKTNAAGAYLIAVPKVAESLKSGQVEESRDPDSASLKLARVDDSASSHGEEGGRNASAARDEDETGGMSGVPELLVKGSRSLNVDIRRTADDPQAYVIFDQRAIEQSGAANVEGFLRERLTMSSSFASNSQLATPNSPFSQKTNSSFSMRGLGSGSTGGSQQLVILVNGRRLANLAQQGLDYQTDLNGIPLGAIERIEVLPASASGIYGGGAVSGVINIVLKRYFAGTDVRATYSSPIDVSAATRAVDVTSGFTLEDGKTNLLFTAAYSDGEQMRVEDRQDLFRANLERVRANDPLAFTRTNGVFVGTTPNIISTTPIAAIGSTMTYAPAGYRGFALDGLAPLLANAGSLNYEPAPTANYFSGLRQTMGSVPDVKSLHFTLRREMAPWLEAYVEGNYRSNVGTGYNGNLATQGVTVPATAPTNPFGQQVTVIVPSAEEWLQQSTSLSRAMDAGVTVKLPRGWQAQGDFSWNQFRSAGTSFSREAAAVNAAIAAGTLDPFRDTLLYGFDMSPYAANTYFRGSSSVNELTIRAAGSLWFMPWIQPNLVVGLNHRKEGRDDQTSTTLYSAPASVDRVLVYPGQSQRTDGIYAEALFPLVKPERKIPGVHLLEVQLAPRHDRVEVHTVRPFGPALATGSYNAANPPELVSSTADYASTNPTLAARWQPVQDVTLRASLANGYAAPTFSQLTPGNPSTTATTVLDPRRGGSAAAVIPDPVGGNPGLTPEKSRNWNLGVVLTPRFAPGFRFSVDYVNIVKNNSIGTLTAQQIVTNEALFPGRVTRGPATDGDPYGVGPITGIDTSALATYRNHHDRGFEIIGVALENARLLPDDAAPVVSDKLERARRSLTDFTAANGMPWPQYFDGKYWQNDLAVRFGVKSVPALLLLDRQGRLVSTAIRGSTLEEEVKHLLD